MSASDPSLAAALETLRQSFAKQAEPETLAALELANAQLVASGAAQRARKAGDHAPDFRLRSTKGEQVALTSLLSHGPLVLSFFRGAWCSFCSLELRALRETFPKIRELGANLVAVSPQASEAAAVMTRNADLPFPVLVDHENALAADYGIAFDLPDELHQIFEEFGHPLPEINGTDRWTLPMPATFVIGQDALIRLAFVDPDYRNRLEPDSIVAVLKGLRQARQN